MSRGETLRLLVKQRVHAVVEEAFGLLDTLTAAYEDSVCALREQERLTSDVQQPLAIKADVPPEYLDQDQDQEPLHKKEETEKLWKETRTPESAAPALEYEEAHVSHVGCNTGNKPFSFYKCSKRFYYKGFLQRHMRFHFGKMSSRCLVRKKCFREKQKKESQQRVHTGEKPFGCDVCGKRFSTQAHLKRHVTVHTGEKPFGCDLCGKRYTVQGSLKRHMRVHTGEKPFSCGVCGKRYTVQGSLKRHMRVHTE